MMHRNETVVDYLKSLGTSGQLMTLAVVLFGVAVMVCFKSRFSWRGVLSTYFVSLLPFFIGVYGSAQHFTFMLDGVANSCGMCDPMHSYARMGSECLRPIVLGALMSSVCVILAFLFSLLGARANAVSAKEGVL